MVPVVAEGSRSNSSGFLSERFSLYRGPLLPSPVARLAFSSGVKREIVSWDFKIVDWTYCHWKKLVQESQQVESGSSRMTDLNFVRPDIHAGCSNLNSPFVDGGCGEDWTNVELCWESTKYRVQIIRILSMALETCIQIKTVTLTVCKKRAMHIQELVTHLHFLLAISFALQWERHRYCQV